MEEFYLDTKVDISVVVPVFNAENSLEELFSRIQNTLQGVQNNFEVIFVDDYSKDKSWLIIQKLKKIAPESIKGIRLSRNYGQHNATLCGIGHAKGNFIVTIDDDLEFSPEDIPLLMNEQQRTNVDLVYGVGKNKRKNVIRKISTSIYKKISRLNHEDYRPDGSSFRFMKSSLAKDILIHGRNFSFVDEFVLWHTSNISAVKVECKKSINKTTRYNAWGLFILIRDLSLISSVAPLRLVSLIGSVMVSVNFIYGVVIIVRKFIFAIKVEGYTSLIVAILFSSGLIMFGIGVVAEYLSKLIKLNYNHPSFKEQEII